MLTWRAAPQPHPSRRLPTRSRTRTPRRRQRSLRPRVSSRWPCGRSRRLRQATTTRTDATSTLPRQLRRRVLRLRQQATRHRQPTGLRHPSGHPLLEAIRLQLGIHRRAIRPLAPMGCRRLAIHLPATPMGTRHLATRRRQGTPRSLTATRRIQDIRPCRHCPTSGGETETIAATAEALAAVVAAAKAETAHQEQASANEPASERARPSLQT